MSSISIATAMQATAIVVTGLSEFRRIRMATIMGNGRHPSYPAGRWFDDPPQMGDMAREPRGVASRAPMSVRSLGAKAAAVRETIAELCAEPPEASELIEEVADRVRRVVTYDTGAWMTTDPETMLPTSMSKSGGSREL